MSSSSERISSSRRPSVSREPLLLVAHGFEPRALAVELDLGLAHVLLEQQRALLERFDHAVRVGLEQRGDTVEQSVDMLTS